MRHDIAIIGGGSAGYAAARTARDAGANVAIVDPGPLGGLCILRGCMPSKAILRSSEVMALMLRAPEFGLLPVQPQADLAAIIARKDRLVEDFAAHRIAQLRDPGFTLYEESASFLSPHRLRVGKEVLRADSTVICTGSVSSRVSIAGLDEAGYITSDEALDLRRQPESLIVLGGGPVAVELAQFFARIGTRVTLLQRSGHILSKGDEDLARPVEERFRAEGMEVYTGTRLHRFTAENGLVTAHFSHQGEERTATASEVLQALGRRPNIDALGLQAAGVETRRGRILVDPEMRTSQSHIFAAGDVNGLHEIVHIAIQQGEVAAYNAVHPEGPARRVDDRLNISVIFTDPAVASVGIGEKQCRESGIPYLVASYPFDDHGKSMCLGETHGHVKLLCRPRGGEVLGAHVVGPQAAELIHELVALLYFRGTVEDLARMPHYHPTLAEILTYPAEELAAQLE